MDKKQTIYLLFLILLLALLVRLPGVWWGHKFFGNTYISAPYPDEALSVRIATDQLAGALGPRTIYPPGLGSQMTALHLLEKSFFAQPPLNLYDLGRLLSVVYGVGVVFLVFLLARRIFRRDRTALLAAFFMTLANLHVTYSHVCHTDSAALFFTLASFYLALKFWEEEQWFDLALAAFFAGWAWICKFSFIQFLPLLTVALVRRQRWKNILLSGACSLAGMTLASGLFFGLPRLKVARAFIGYLFFRFPHYNRVFNLIYVPVTIIMGLSLPVFVLSLIGFILITERYRWAILRKPAFWLFGLPWLIYGLGSFGLSFSPSRFFLPLLPLFCLLAAYALDRVKKAAVFYFLLVLVIGWQTLGLFGTQRYFIWDPRDLAGRWLLENVPTDTAISIGGPYAQVPDKYKTSLYLDEKYVVLAQQGYKRFLFVNNLSLALAGRYPTRREMYHVDRKHRHDVDIPLILQGKAPYRLIKKFPLAFWTPEQIIWQKLGYDPEDLIGDALIFERIEEK